MGELDLVATIYDTAFNYQTNRTFFQFDTVFHLRDTANPADTVSISRQFDQQMINLVRSNMRSLGYIDSTPTQNFQPDVLTSISITASRNYTAYSFYPWWGYPGYPFPPCCFGGPGWGWPTTVVTSYRVGTVFIDMIDVDQSIATDTIQVIWNGAINGPFEGSAPVSMERIDRTFNQAFVQSEYLRLLAATP
ncbi:MAG: DUF4136 domain-containing protein [Gemmatimonadetes bacterium]|nr:MAG: DUF4136 domain-containing protein [Gemmatimonadota bacterium]